MEYLSLMLLAVGVVTAQAGTKYDGIVNNIHIYDNDLFVTESSPGENSNNTKEGTKLASRNRAKYNTPTAQTIAIKYPDITTVDYTNTKPEPYLTTPSKYIASTAPSLNTYLPYKTYNTVTTRAPSTVIPSAYLPSALPGTMCGNIQCQPNEECCKTCDDQGNLIPANHCESRLNGNPGCPMPLCIPKENPCGTIQCQTGEECCKTCDEQGNLVPASHCESNLNGSPGCPMAFCVPKGQTCEGKTCGESCRLGGHPGVCDGKGTCRNILENPCSASGCEGKQCGDFCLVGDIAGYCDSDRKCFHGGKPGCGAGFCTCGKECKMTNGGIGVCQTDGKTCAINVQQPNCKPEKVCEDILEAAECQKISAHGLCDLGSTSFGLLCVSTCGLQSNCENKITAN